MCKALVAQMKSALMAIKEFDREIEAICDVHQDFALFKSLPGAGQIYASRLIVAFGSDRQRWLSADEVTQLSGIAPVIERSGKSCWVRWRYFCPKFLRQSFHEYAGESVRHSFWARAYYEQQRSKGKSHQAATRALAFKWIRIIYRCWKNRTAYDEVKYLEGLRQKRSSLLNYAANNPA
jgi:transposase